jgi:hypothetical protein
MRIGIHLRNIRSAIRLISFIVISSVTADLSAQNVQVRGGFFQDSVVVGDVARFYLAASYPSNLNILFPDSTFQYTPLEYEGKEYFATKTSDGISYDSVIYHLSVFELDSLQQLFLPVFQVNEKDCTLYLSNPDTILLRSIIDDIRLDTLELGKLPLKETLAYHSIDTIINYPVIFFVLAVTLTVVAIVWFVFGKRIRKHYRMKRMMKAHQQFMQVFTREIGNVQTHHTPAITESTVAHWKKYMEQLERRPYTKLTSKEIQRIERNENLGNILHSIDASIYGHQTATASLFEELKSFAQQRFHKKLEEVKNG